MNFTISDGEYIPYEDIKKDYINGLRANALQEKYNISPGMYKSLLDRFEAEGVKVARRRKKKCRKPSYIHYNRAYDHYIVERIINGKKIYGGAFKKKAEAELRRNELEANGWRISDG